MTAKSFELQNVARVSRLLSFCVGMFCAVSTSAQSITASNQPPGVTVLDCKWEKTHYLPPLDSSFPTPPAVGENVEGVPSATRAPVKSSDAYRYSIRVRNEGPKVLKSMAWDYVFSDLDSKQELGRRSLNSFEKVGLNETKWIDLRPVHLAPPKVTTVEGLKKDHRSPFDERIEIKCVLYADGTGWKAADADSKTCNELVRLTLHPDTRRQ